MKIVVEQFGFNRVLQRSKYLYPNNRRFVSKCTFICNGKDNSACGFRLALRGTVDEETLSRRWRPNSDTPRGGGTTAARRGRHTMGTGDERIGGVSWSDGSASSRVHHGAVTITGAFSQSPPAFDCIQNRC